MGQRSYNLLKKNHITFLVVLLASTCIHWVGASYLCHINCQALECDDQLATSCNACAQYFTGGKPSTCEWDSSLEDVFLAKTTGDFTFSSGSGRTCSNYPYRGNYVNNVDLNITSSPISTPHYKVDLVVWALFMDEWSNSDLKFTMADGGGTRQFYKNSSVLNQTLCEEESQTDGFQRLSMTFIHTHRTNATRFRVQMTKSGGNPKFGIGDLLVIAYRCHQYCLTCTGPAVNQCNSCISTHWLLGTTCQDSCPAGYGLSTSKVCVLCNDYCQTCFNTDKNCSSCKSTSSLGTQVYAVQNHLKCQIICPDGFFHFLATQQCLSCDFHCVDLSITSQLINSGQSFEYTYRFSEDMDWSSFDWQNDWQDFLYFTSTNPSINFYNDFSVVHTILNTTSFQLVLTPNVGVNLATDNLCTVVKPEAGNPVNVSANLKKLRPRVYITYSCITQSTKFVTMTMNKLEIQATETIQYLFTFSDPIDFSRFDWNVWNFTNMNKNITTYNLGDDFITTHVPISSTSFKITFTPKTWTFFSNATFCTSVQQQSKNGLQFSAQWYKLAPSVYTQSICGVIFACHPYCLTCNDLNPLNCPTCGNLIRVGSNTSDSQIYKVQNQNRCEVVCPAGHFDHNPSKTCRLCTTHCVNLTITSQFLNAGESIEFTYTFTETMNWVGFNWNDFLSFTCTNTSIDTGNDFNIVSVSSGNTLKLTLTPKPTKYLVNEQFCTSIKAQASNPTKRALSQNKLDSSVYTSSDCKFWSTPQESLAISNSVDQPTKTIEFTFSFTGPMNLTDFNYLDFLSLTLNDTNLNIPNNYTCDYSYVSPEDFSVSFKLTLIVGKWTFFQATSFCVAIEVESTNIIQFSAKWYKLAPSVYTQTNCAVIVACHPYCLTCDTDPTNCLICDDQIRVGSNTSDSQIYKVQNQNRCEVVCPAGHFDHNPSKTCRICTTHCVNLTITSQFLNAGESIEFTYTFTETMNWVGFNWNDFLSFTCTNTSIDTGNDFNIVSVSSGNTLKLTLTPKPTKYLVNEQFCTSIKAQASNPTKRALSQNKLDSSVYTSSDCKFWSTPQESLAISNSVDQPTKTIEFTFSFTGPMNLTDFNYLDFLSLTSNDTNLNMQDNFTQVYSFTAPEENCQTFKVVLKSKQMTFFDNSSFCAITKEQDETNFQFSAKWYKLAPAVYEQSSCGIMYSCYPYCDVCQGSSTNCLSCLDTILIEGDTDPTQVYKVQNQNACEAICPSGYFDHLPSRQCLQCAVHCVNFTITNEFLLNGKSLNYSSLEFTYTFTEDFIVSTFDWSAFLSFNCTNSSIDPLTDFAIDYHQIDSQTFKLILTPKEGKFLINEDFCTFIKPLPLNPYQRSISQNKLNPTVYEMLDCVIWSTPQVNLSTTHSISVADKYLQFMFTFTSEMNFTGFWYQNFLSLNQSDPDLVFARDFSVAYFLIDNWNFKLKLTANLGVHFVDQLFCAVTHQQNNNLIQFSAEWYKLHSSVYGHSECVSWSLPPVNLTIFGQAIANGSYSTYCYFTFTFTSPINFANFKYKGFVDFQVDNPRLSLQNNFTISYNQIDDSSFSLTLNYKPRTRFLDTTTCFKVKQKPDANLNFSIDMTPLGPTVYEQSSCIFWQTPGQLRFYHFKEIQNLNNKMQDLFTQKGHQQLVKSGALSFIMPGTQWTSLALLHRPRVIQNLYEGTRFWGSFVLFDVPPYQFDTNRTKYTLLSPNSDILEKINRRLLAQSEISSVEQWRFSRTGHSGFFILDSYIQLALIAFAWILFAFAKACEWKNQSNKTSVKVMARVMVLFHKIHEMALFYLLLSSLIEYKNLDLNVYMHRISMIISFVVLTYYLVYELKVFYDMAGYPNAKIHTESYVWYLKNYGYFLAYYRFEEYNDYNQWIWRHFLRPYNYHILTFVKRVLMFCATPLFYDYWLYPAYIITFLQLMDVMRFLLTIPYHKMWRNILYLTLEMLLLLFFVSTLVNQLADRELFDEYDQVKNIKYKQIYDFSGWIGMLMCSFYNVLFVLASLSELIVVFTYKDCIENMMWENRHSYYLKLYDHFQKYEEYYSLIKTYKNEKKLENQQKKNSTYINWVNKLHNAQPITDLSRDKLKVFKQIVDRGDILKFDLKDKQKLKHTIEVKIQSIILHSFKHPQIPHKNHQQQLYEQERTSKTHLRPERQQENTRWLRKNKQIIKPIENQLPLPIFKIWLEVVPAMYKSDFKFNNRKQGVNIPKKVQTTVNSETMDQDFLKQITKTLMKFYDHGTGISQIKISTFMKVNLAKYKDNQEIKFDRRSMRQKMVILHGREKEKIQLREMMEGFPIDLEQLKKSCYWNLVLNEQVNNSSSQSSNSECKTNLRKVSILCDSDSEQGRKTNISTGMSNSNEFDVPSSSKSINHKQSQKNEQQNYFGKPSKTKTYEKNIMHHESEGIKHFNKSQQNNLIERSIGNCHQNQKNSQGYIKIQDDDSYVKSRLTKALRKPRVQPKWDGNKAQGENSGQGLNQDYL